MGVASKALLTPKELAEAIGASESSLRRWVDSGDIRLSRTAGGHRRIPLPEAIRFVRAIGATVVRPDILGLGHEGQARPELLARPEEERLFEALRAGEGEVARGLIVAWYLEGRSLAALFDGPVRHALHRLGELWKHEERGILVEHRGTAMCAEAVTSVRGLLPQPGEGAPLALGGAPEGDPYQLPTMMAAAVLAEAGWRDVNFGPDTPVELIGAEAAQRGAKLVWLSLSAPPDPKVLPRSIARLAAALRKQHVRLVLGGRHAAECAPPREANVKLVGSMEELAEFARGSNAGR